MTDSDTFSPCRRWQLRFSQLHWGVPEHHLQRTMGMTPRRPMGGWREQGMAAILGVTFTYQENRWENGSRIDLGVGGT